MSRLLAAKHETALVQTVQNVTVSNVCAFEPDPMRFQCFLQTKIGQDCSDDRVSSESTPSRQSQSQNVQHDIPGHAAPGVVDHNDPVTITVVGNAQIRLLGDHPRPNGTRMCGSAVLVDELAILVCVHLDHLRTQLSQQRRCRVACCPVSAVHHDPDTLEREPWVILPHEGYVFLARILDPVSATHFVAMYSRRIAEFDETKVPFNRFLVCVCQLATARPKELDPVVLRRIV